MRKERLLLYHPEMPGFLLPYMETEEMMRLRDIGMNCGCEYTAFPRFCRIPRYSRYEHSVGTALIVWHYTQDRTQTLAALFHDIATPVFAHSIDFLRGDHMKQEATEEGTEEILRNSAVIRKLLENDGIMVEEVCDYHRYPIADNDSPRLSADRLEYTIGNMLGFGFASQETAAYLYGHVVKGQAEDGATELVFDEKEAARTFAYHSLECSRVYVCKEDRYAMQRVSEVIRDALQYGVLTRDDLYTTETQVIRKLNEDMRTKQLWQAFRGLSEIVPITETNQQDARIIPAKKRRIDPYIRDTGRVSEVYKDYGSALEEFLAESQEEAVCAQ